MLHRNYSVACQTVPIKSSFAIKLIPYPWATSDFFTSDTRDKGLELVLLDLVTPSPICSIACGATSLLGSHLNSADFFLQVAIVASYSSEAALNKFYTVNVI